VSEEKLSRWRRAQDHERTYWEERGDVAAIIARRKPHYERALARIAELLPERPLIADIGSGPTCWTQFLRGRKVYADPLMGTYAQRWRESLPEGRPLAAAGEALPFRSGCFDLVFSVNAIDHSADPEAMLRECARIARPGGLLAISVYAHPPIRALAGRLRDALGFTDDPHPHAFTRKGFLGLFGRCGLEVAEVLNLGPVSFRTKLRLLQRAEPLVLARPRPP